MLVRVSAEVGSPVLNLRARYSHPIRCPHQGAAVPVDGKNRVQRGADTCGVGLNINLLEIQCKGECREQS